MTKYYVVIRGRGEVPAIYSTWEECKQATTGYRGALFQSFNTLSEANTYKERHVKRVVNNVRSTTDIPIIGRIQAYVDGSSMSTGAGYGIVLIDGNNVNQYSGRVPDYDGKTPTNNFAELYAIAVAIKNTIGSITIYSDSEYSINCLTSWYKEWELNDWKTSRGEPVVNSEIIKHIISELKNRDVTFEYVKGHSDNKYNNLADHLAKQGAQSK